MFLGSNPTGACRGMGSKFSYHFGDIHIYIYTYGEYVEVIVGIHQYHSVSNIAQCNPAAVR